jgi:hypothetical protein
MSVVRRHGRIPDYASLHPGYMALFCHAGMTNGEALAHKEMAQ